MINLKNRKWVTFVGLILVVVFTFSACEEKEKKGESTETTEAKGSEAETEPEKMPTAKEIGKAYGMIFASSLKELDIEMDLGSFKDGFKEVMSAKEKDKDKLQNAEKVLMTAFQLAEKRRVEKIQKENADFLEKNGKKKGVITTEKGLQYEVVKEGDGPSPTLDDSVSIHYAGKLIDGREFDNSRNPNTGGEPFVLKDFNGVIEGWREGLLLMKKGGVYKLYVPYNLAYGERGIRGQRGEEIIPPYATLIFDIEIIDVAPKPIDDMEQPE